jgi:lipid A 3-O-deacylase
MLSAILFSMAAVSTDTFPAVSAAAADTPVVVVRVAPEARADADRPARSFSFLAENDVLYLGGRNNTDQHYTNGVQAVWTTLWWPKLLQGAGWWPAQACDQRYIDRPPAACGAVSVGLGQTMYTPRDLQRGDTIYDDRPFVGLAYATGSLHILRDRHTIGLDAQIGVIGSAAAAQYTQSMAHWWWAPGAVLPQGWKNQLSNQPAVDLGARYSYTLATPELLNGFTLDATPRVRVQFGNVTGAARAGVRVRGGWNMPREFTFGRIGTTGVRPLRAAARWLAAGSYYAVAEWEERAVGWNTLVTGGAMDGTAWRDNLRLQSRGRDLLWGGSVRFGGVTITQQWVRRSPEFTSRTGSDAERLDHRFGITTVSFSRGL